jgi:sigma-54 specific flagellar transcriptional regulator A
VPRRVQHVWTVLSNRTGQPAPTLSAGVLEAMTRYEWPGNVRELQNTVERMTLLHQGSGVLDVGDLPPKIQSLSVRSGLTVVPRGPMPSSVDALPTSKPSMMGPARVAPPVIADPLPAANSSPSATNGAQMLSPKDFELPLDGIDLREAVQAFEMSLIDQALERTGGNKNQASMLLRMNRTTLVEKLRKRQR